MVDAGRDASTVNHVRRVIRGAFGTHPSSPALAWPWMSSKVESEGQLRFYDPAQIACLKAHAHTALDVAVYTLAAEAGPRLSEIRGLKVRNVDFASGLLRFEDGYTTKGGHAGNKGRRVRSVPMSANVACLQGIHSEATTGIEPVSTALQRARTGNSAHLSSALAREIGTSCCAQFCSRLPKVASLGSPWGALARVTGRVVN